MKKLDEIPKKTIFEAPEGYFDKLPGIIQSRIADEKPQPFYVPYYKVAMKYALPVAVVIVAVFFIFRSGESPATAEEMLASVSTEELAIYLSESGISTDELLENIDFSDEEIQELNSAPSLFDEDIEEGKIDDLLEEFETEYY